MSIPFKTKKKVEEFILPSGDRMVIAPIDGYCEDLLADKNAFKQVRKPGSPIKQKKDPFSMVLGHCIQHLDSANGKPELKHLREMYLGDRMYALIALRKISNGNDLIVDYTCASCEEQIKFDIDIQNDVLDSSKTKEVVYQQKGVIGDKDMKIVKVDGVNFVLRQLKTKDHELMETRIKSSNGALSNTYLIMASVVGWYVSNNKKGEPEITPLSVKDVQEMTVVQSQQLKEEIDKFTIGPDVLIHSECPECGTEIATPVITANFFKSQTHTEKSSSSGEQNAQQP